MKTATTVIIMLLTMPISYAMMDEALKRMRVRNRARAWMCKWFRLEKMATEDCQERKQT